MGCDIYLGDALECLREMPDASLDSVVCDPPYGLSAAKNSGKISKGGFMGKLWDYDVPSVEIWREALRVLKPGAHMLVACGTRTQHRMATNIEDAGFEIRDVITHHYASGFPKSLNVSKAIDRFHCAERAVVGRSRDKKYSASGVTSGASIGGVNGGYNYQSEFEITAPATDDAKKWSGFGTGLKPSTEFWTLCRRPLEKGLSIAANVLKFGCGAINIDQSRIGTSDNLNGGTYSKNSEYIKNENEIFGERRKVHTGFVQPQGRFPANLILQCSCDGPPHEAECPAGQLDRQSGVSKNCGYRKNPSTNKTTWFGRKDGSHIEGPRGYNDTGAASRFFYCAKASQAERNAGLEGVGVSRNAHPT